MRLMLLLVVVGLLTGCQYPLMPWSGHEPRSGVSQRTFKPLPSEEWHDGKPDIVKHVQTALHQKGYYNGPISGVINDKTRQALEAFQKDKHELKQDGTLDDGTFHDLTVEE